MLHRATVQYSPVLHVVILMHSSNHAHSDHEQQLAKIMAEVGSSTSSPGVSLHEWLDEESVNDEERINTTKTKPKAIYKGTYCIETLIIIMHVPFLWEYRIQ